MNQKGCSGAGGIGDVYSKNICYNEAVPEAKVRWGNPCSPASKCEVCVGNCTLDSDCEGDLRCAHRERNVNVPGCEFRSQWLLEDQSHNHCKTKTVFQCKVLFSVIVSNKSLSPN